MDPRFTDPALAQRNTYPPIRLERPADRIIAELRAVLAPLLDEPYVTAGPYFASWEECRFCAQEFDKRHAPDCPVLRRDELLGR